jgi:ATP-binding cassette subfamily B protein
MGLLNPTHGNIEVDGIKIDQRNYRKFQSKIAHVPQNIYLADTTIAENIAFGIPIKNINIANIKLAAKKAQISDTIESWEMGYNTNIGERGVRISGGQRQRIGIARALYKNASIIVFDEATSALDNATEEEVMKSIEKIGDDITMIIVAHRLTTLKNCDMIFDIKNGEVVKSGKYTEIINY